MTNPLNKHNIWRYALDKLMGNKKEGRKPSLSPIRIAKDLKTLANIANKRLDNLINAGFGNLEYVKTVKSYVNTGRSDLSQVAPAAQKAALSVIADFVYDNDVSKVGNMRRNVKKWAKENAAILESKTAQELYHGDPMQAFADFQNWRFTMRNQLYDDKKANYSMLYRFIAWVQIQPTQNKDGTFSKRLDSKYKSGDEIALAIWKWKSSGEPRPDMIEDDTQVPRRKRGRKFR